VDAGAVAGVIEPVTAGLSGVELEQAAMATGPGRCGGEQDS
jgi:hypothetical protein